MYAILEWSKRRDLKFGVKATFNGMTSSPEFHKDLLIVPKKFGGGHTDRMVIS
jgi:hypothetical protein